MSTSPPGVEDAQRVQHEQDIAQREAYEYWGYMFKDDKTGTDKLKGLLRGLKNVMNKQFEQSDNPDLTPTQLATFYRELNGNYDQLFLGTPSASLAFIYKSLGCLHSLQPLTYSTTFTDPTVPSLKTEGWIMWQTVQILLAPDEHSIFLMDAVQHWDVFDPITGEMYPKILPRACFPLEPDKHMVAWYEGVSERLRSEAEEEQRQRDVEAERAEVKRIRAQQRGESDDEESVDSRAPAIAYFRNPLYRHVDGPYAGRPGIVRSASKPPRRPVVSPRQSMMEKGKNAAASVGNVMKNVASPHLWDGGKRDGDRRRRSSVPHDEQLPPRMGDKISPRASSIASNGSHRRRRSSPRHSGGEDALAGDDIGSPVFTPETVVPPRHGSPRGPPPPRQQQFPYQHQHSPRVESPLRHTRSHEEQATQPPPGDYFEGYENVQGPPPNRRNSAFDVATPPPVPAPNGIGQSFAPSHAPLFATNVAKHPQPFPPLGNRPLSVPPQMGATPPTGPGGRPPPPQMQAPPPDQYQQNRPRKSSNLRHGNARFPSPDPSRASDRYSSRDGYDDRPPPPPSQGGPPPGWNGNRPPSVPPPDRRHHDHRGSRYEPSPHRSSRSGRQPDEVSPPYPTSSGHGHRHKSSTGSRQEIPPRGDHHRHSHRSSRYESPSDEDSPSPSPSPSPPRRHSDDRRRHSSARRSGYDDRPPPPPSSGHSSRRRRRSSRPDYEEDPSEGLSPPPPSHGAGRRSSGASQNRYNPSNAGTSAADPRRSDVSRGSRHSRDEMVGDRRNDLSPDPESLAEDGEAGLPQPSEQGDDQTPHRPKMTRFVTPQRGVDGRAYPDFSY
ncbi:hypothetical protein K431DRAFT_248186 [Polychaeton citri CBS 116435]|uniref:DUF7514 domain-containing protein n=1 Tax=Polychaeton citri CBS 116435 TaxID=1314669 RepID=A0A9P4Q9L2_9PEZI|nr:hypothetical protein K431DRAFT_248186 [Polychaeton citri CBS 116435]